MNKVAIELCLVFLVAPIVVLAGHVVADLINRATGRHGGAMIVRSRWYGPAFDKIVLSHMADNLDLAGHYFRDQIRDDLHAHVATSPSEHSKPPSEYPYFHTGKLWGSFGWEVDRKGLVTRVGSGDPVARYLEFGTSRVVARGKIYPGLAPRPTIRRNLFDHRLDIARLICRPL